MESFIPETHDDFEDDDFPVVLNSENFPEFNWSPATTNLIIDKCLPPLSRSHLQSCADTLISLTFWDMTTLENIQTCLSNLPQLKKLVFSNVLIDEYQRLETRTLTCGIIELPHLEELNFLSHCRVTKDDYWLLDLFFRHVRCGNLKKFSFFAEQDVGLFTARPHNEVLERHYKVENPALPAAFMLQHAKTLKEVLIGGDGVTLLPTENMNIHELPSVQLTTIHFQLDVPGITYLLDCQNGLTQLTCEDFSRVAPPTPGNPDQNNLLLLPVLNCIARNFETIACIDISPILVMEELTPELVEKFTINTEHFQHCHSLRTLCLRLCFMEKFINFANSYQGHVINLHLLPSSLVQLEVNTDVYDDKEIQLLSQRMSEFKQLQRLSFACSPQNSYRIGSDWLPALENLPRIHNINFYNGRMSVADQAEAAQFLNSDNYPPPRINMTLNCRGVFFR